MKWDDYLKLFLDKYRDQPDDYVVSLGHWEVRPTAIPGISLPELIADFQMTVGELKALEARGQN